MTEEASRTDDAAEREAPITDIRTERRRVPVPRLLLFSLPLNLLALAAGCWMFVNAFILLDETAPVAMVGISLVNIVVLTLLGRRIIRMRAVDQQRRYSRVELELDGTVNGHPCHITELSLGGCQIELPNGAEITAGQNVDVRFRLGGISFELASAVRGLGSSHTGGILLRIAFHPGQNGYIERLALGMLADGGKAWAA